MYQYRAYTLDKRIVEGAIDASSEAMAEEYLRKAGYRQVLTLKKTRVSLQIGRIFRWSSRINRMDVVDLFQQLATLVESRMPVVQALGLLAEQSPQGVLKDNIIKVGQKLSGGASFSQALSFFPRMVPAHYCEVIRVSEQSGDIPRGLRLVAGYMEKEHIMSKNLTRTLGYPAFLVGMAVIVISVIAIVALPALADLFDSLDATLPLATRLLTSLTNFVAHNLAYLILSLASIAAFIVCYVKSAAGKQTIGRLSLKLPVIGSIVILRNICRFCRNTAMLLEAGLTLPQCLTSVSGVIDNSVIKTAVNDVHQELIKGKGLSRPMTGNRLFPRLLVDMVHIGEKTDSLQPSFTAMADFYEKKLDLKMQKLLSMVEPASIIVIGLIVSFIGLAIISPIYTIYQNLRT